MTSQYPLSESDLVIKNRELEVKVMYFQSLGTIFRHKIQDMIRGMTDGEAPTDEERGAPPNRSASAKQVAEIVELREALVKAFGGGGGGAVSANNSVKEHSPTTGVVSDSNTDELYWKDQFLKLSKDLHSLGPPTSDVTLHQVMEDRDALRKKLEEMERTVAHLRSEQTKLCQATRLKPEKEKEGTPFQEDANEGSPQRALVAKLFAAVEKQQSMRLSHQSAGGSNAQEDIIALVKEVDNRNRTLRVRVDSTRQKLHAEQTRHLMVTEELTNQVLELSTKLQTSKRENKSIVDLHSQELLRRLAAEKMVATLEAKLRSRDGIIEELQQKVLLLSPAEDDEGDVPRTNKTSMLVEAVKKENEVLHEQIRHLSVRCTDIEEKESCAHQALEDSRQECVGLKARLLLLQKNAENEHESTTNRNTMTADADEAMSEVVKLQKTITGTIDGFRSSENLASVATTAQRIQSFFDDRESVVMCTSSHLINMGTSLETLSLRLQLLLEQCGVWAARGSKIEMDKLQKIVCVTDEMLENVGRQRVLRESNDGAWREIRDTRSGHVFYTTNEVDRTPFAHQ